MANKRKKGSNKECPYRGGSPEKQADKHGGGPTNKQFVTDGAFVSACDKAGVKPTSRQASKFRNGKGAAYKAK